MFLRLHMVGNPGESALTGYGNRGAAPVTASPDASWNRFPAPSVLTVPPHSQGMVDRVRTKAGIGPCSGLLHSVHAARFRRTGDAHQSPYEIHRCVWRIVLGRRGHAGVPVSRSVEPQLTLRDSEAALVPMGLCHGRGDQTTAGSPGKPFFSSTVYTGNRR